MTGSMFLCWHNDAISLRSIYWMYSRSFTWSVKASSDVARCSFLVTGAILFPVQAPVQVEAHHAVMLCHGTMEDKGHSAARRIKLKLWKTYGIFPDKQQRGLQVQCFCSFRSGGNDGVSFRLLHSFIISSCSKKHFNIYLEVKERKLWWPGMFGEGPQFHLWFWFAFDYLRLSLMYTDN